MKRLSRHAITGTFAALMLGTLAVAGISTAGPAAAEAPAMAMGSIYQTTSVNLRTADSTTSTRPVLTHQNAVANQQALNELAGPSVIG